MNTKSKFAALSAAFVMAGSAEAAIVTYEVSQNFSTYNNSADGASATHAGGGLLSGTVSFDSDTGTFLSAELTSFLPGPESRQSFYDTQADAVADGVSTTASMTGSALTLNSDYAYTILNGSYLPQYSAVLSLDFGSSVIGDATINAAIGEIFNTYGWYDTVYGQIYSAVTFGSQYGEATFSLVDANSGWGAVLETPLPAAFPLMAGGLAVFGGLQRRRRCAKAA